MFLYLSCYLGGHNRITNRSDGQTIKTQVAINWSDPLMSFHRTAVCWVVRLSYPVVVGKTVCAVHAQKNQSSKSLVAPAVGRRWAQCTQKNLTTLQIFMDAESKESSLWFQPSVTSLCLQACMYAVSAGWLQVTQSGCMWGILDIYTVFHMRIMLCNVDFSWVCVCVSPKTWQSS